MEELDYKDLYNSDYIRKILENYKVNQDETNKTELKNVVSTIEEIIFSEEKKDEKNRIMTDAEILQIGDLMSVLYLILNRATSGVVGLGNIRRDGLKNLLDEGKSQ